MKTKQEQKWILTSSFPTLSSCEVRCFLLRYFLGDYALHTCDIFLFKLPGNGWLSFWFGWTNLRQTTYIFRKTRNESAVWPHSVPIFTWSHFFRNSALLPLKRCGAFMSYGTGRTKTLTVKLLGCLRLSLIGHSKEIALWALSFSVASLMAASMFTLLENFRC